MFKIRTEPKFRKSNGAQIRSSSGRAETHSLAHGRDHAACNKWTALSLPLPVFHLSSLSGVMPPAGDHLNNGGKLEEPTQRGREEEGRDK